MYHPMIGEDFQICSVPPPRQRKITYHSRAAFFLKSIPPTEEGGCGGCWDYESIPLPKSRKKLSQQKWEWHFVNTVKVLKSNKSS